MAITELKLRRGTTTDHQSFTGAEGEITIDTSKDTLVVHDGTTVGGHPLSKASEAKGWTTTEHFTSDGTWTKTGKDGLKRIKVTAWGGGGGGGNGTNERGGSGGGQGGYGYVILDVASVTDNVSVTLGGGGAGGVNGTLGGTTTFGSSISASGGQGGRQDSQTFGADYSGPGRITGTGTVELGGQGGSPGGGMRDHAYESGGIGGGPGGAGERDGIGVCGAGGGGGANSNGFAGADGSVLVEEIYGEV
jgi:hypothetical protein